MRTNQRVGAVVIKDNKILLIHRFRDGEEYWVLPGGGVEEGESLEEALHREVKEETCLDLISFKLIGTSNEADHQHYFYSCQLSEGTPCIGGPEKDNSSVTNIYILEWIDIQNASQLKIYPKIPTNILRV
jgi:ADP-ribose pyrophosphatase YjhB (NUDIX family)